MLTMHLNDIPSGTASLHQFYFTQIGTVAISVVPLSWTSWKWVAPAGSSPGSIFLYFAQMWLNIWHFMRRLVPSSIQCLHGMWDQEGYDLLLRAKLCVQVWGIHPVLEFTRQFRRMNWLALQMTHKGGHWDREATGWVVAWCQVNEVLCTKAERGGGWKEQKKHMKCIQMYLITGTNGVILPVLRCAWEMTSLENLIFLYVHMLLKCVLWF